MIKRNSKRGFTLSETLLTLVIIGVIGAIAVPKFVGFVQAKILKTQLQDTYRELKTAMADIQRSKSGSSAPWSMSFDTNGSVSLAKEFHDVMKGAGALITPSSTLDNPINMWDETNTDPINCPKCYKYSNGTSAVLGEPYGLAAAGFTTSKGVIMQFVSRTPTQYCNLPSTNILKRVYGCGEVIVDINGTTGPNQFGKDVFSFLIQLKPADSMNSDDSYIVTAAGADMTVTDATFKNNYCKSGSIAASRMCTFPKLTGKIPF